MVHNGASRAIRVEKLVVDGYQRRKGERKRTIGVKVNKGEGFLFFGMHKQVWLVGHLNQGLKAQNEPLAGQITSQLPSLIRNPPNRHYS